MSLLAKRAGLVLVLLAVLLGRSPAQADQGPPEPPPAPLLGAPEEPEPPPAPLLTPEEPEPEPAPLLVPESLQAKAAPRPDGTRGLRGAAWGGVALTLSLLTAGTVLGALTQQRSDALSLSTAPRAGEPAPVYDAAQHLAYTDLQSQGRTLNSATIACFSIGGALAVVSGVLFWNAARLQAKQKRLALGPTLGPGGGQVLLGGSF